MHFGCPEASMNNLNFFKSAHVRALFLSDFFPKMSCLKILKAELPNLVSKNFFHNRLKINNGTIYQ